MTKSKRIATCVASLAMALILSVGVFGAGPNRVRVVEEPPVAIVPFDFSYPGKLP